MSKIDDILDRTQGHFDQIAALLQEILGSRTCR
jgi:hypothetical protein